MALFITSDNEQWEHELYIYIYYIYFMWFVHKKKFITIQQKYWLLIIQHLIVFIPLSIYLSIYPSIIPSIYLSTYISIKILIYLYIHSSIYLSILPSIYLSTYLSIWILIYLSTHSSIYLYNSWPFYPSIHLSIYQSTWKHDEAHEKELVSVVAPLPWGELDAQLVCVKKLLHIALRMRYLKSRD